MIPIVWIGWIQKKLNHVKKYHYDNIQLIYKNEILEQYHIETDIFTNDDFKENNNINLVITKHRYINYEPHDDWDVDYDAYDFYDDDN